LTTVAPVMRVGRPAQTWPAVGCRQWIMFPGAAPLVATTKELWGQRFFRRPDPGPFKKPTNGGEGRNQEALADARSVGQRCAAGLQPAGVFADGIEASRRWVRQNHSVDAASAATPPCSKPGGGPLVGSPYAQADPALCCKGFECHAFIEMPADEPCPD